MRKITRVTLTTAGICIIAGLGFSLAGWFMGGEPGFWINRKGLFTNQDLREQSQSQMEVLEKTELEPFEDMDLRIDYNDIFIEPSEDGRYYMEYRLSSRGRKPEYGVKNGILTVTCTRDPQESRNWGGMGFLVMGDGIYREAGRATIYVPEEASLGMVKLSSNAGSVVYHGPQTKTLEITSQYGGTTIRDGAAETVRLTASDGSVFLDGGAYTELYLVNKYGATDLEEITAETIDIQAADGQINMDSVSASSIALEDKYGAINGSRINADSIKVKQSDGACRFQKADIKEGTFENSYGRTELDLVGNETEYNYDLTMKYGSIKINDRKFEEESVRENNGADRTLTITASDGSIRITTN